MGFYLIAMLVDGGHMWVIDVIDAACEIGGLRGWLRRCEGRF